MADETTGDKRAADAASSGTQGTGKIAGRDAGAPKGAPAPVPPPVSGGSAAAQPGIGADIAKILEEVKLPERRAVGEEKKTAAQAKDIDALLSNPQPPVTTEAATSVVAPASDALQSLHTFKQDLQQVVRDQKISAVRAAALQQDKRREPQSDVPTEQPRSSRVRNFVLLGLLLVFLGGAALFGVYVVVKGRATPLPQQPTDSLVFAEQSVSLALDGQAPQQLKSLLSEARGAASASLGSVTRIAPIKTEITESGEATRLATLSEFFAALGISPPSELLRALSQEFFFGLHTVDKNAPLLVIPVLSYDRAFAGMLQWESHINADLAPVYTRVPDLTANESGIPQRRTFSDVVMRNYDVRALTDDNGEVVLFYSFPTRNILIIAESPYTFTELLSRLQAQRKL